MVDVNPTKPVLLRGYAVSHVASIRSPPVRVGPLAKITFLVGRNNHGKSTVLRASQLFAGRGVDPAYVDAILPEKRRLSVGAEPSHVERELLISLTEDSWPQQIVRTNNWSTFCQIGAKENLGFARGDEFLAWIALENTRGRKPREDALDVDRWSHALGVRPSRDKLAEGLAGIPPESGRLSGFLAATEGPAWAAVPAFREIVDLVGAPVRELDAGKGLVRDVLDWQAPDTAERDHEHKEDRFRRLEQLLRDVLEDETARIHVPANARTFQVATAQTGGRRLDIDRLGDGIKQVLMLGAAALRHDDTLICIEEPEIHLHPGLQRRLMTHLRDRTTNQYLVATHSTHILDTAGAAVFHVVHDGDSTSVTEGIRVDDLVRVSEDLGYRASDLLQANYVIWVEGPADRIYWRRWLELFDPTLQEGVHYTAISYGGSLASNATLGPDAGSPRGGDGAEVTAMATEDLVDLMTLGRRCTLIADSDKRAADEALRADLERLTAAAGATLRGNLLVLTHVRTVENLLPRDVLRSAVRSAHPRVGADYEPPEDLFSNPFEGLLPSSPAKVRVARACAPLITREHLLADAELLCAVADLASRIRLANGLSQAAEPHRPDPSALGPESRPPATG